MKNLILTLALLVSFSSFSQNKIMSEEEITELALQISESTSGRNISNNDITIMRTYAVGRTIVCYYNVPHAMELDGDDVKNQRVNQMKVSGFGEVFVSYSYIQSAQKTLGNHTFYIFRLDGWLAGWLAGWLGMAY